MYHFLHIRPSSHLHLFKNNFTWRKPIIAKLIKYFSILITYQAGDVSLSMYISSLKKIWKYSLSSISFPFSWITFVGDANWRVEKDQLLIRAISNRAMSSAVNQTLMAKKKLECDWKMSCILFVLYDFHNRMLSAFES